MYLTVGSMIKINNIVSGSNNITLRKVNLPCEFDKMYVDKDLIEEKLYQMIDQFHEKNTHVQSYSILFNEIHQFYDGSGRTCKTPFANDG